MNHTLGAIILATAVCFAAIQTKAGIDVPWTLDPAIVARLERSIVMPNGAKPIAAYTRHYEPGFDHGRRTVFGLLKQGGDRQAYISNHLPIIMDGGCSVVELTFDVEAGKVISITCHGGA